MEERAVVSGSKDGQKQENPAVMNRRKGTGFFEGFVTGVVALIIFALLISGITTHLLPLPEADVTLPRSQVVQVDDGPLAGSVVVRYLGSISKPGIALIEKEFEKLSKERPIWLSMQSGGGDIEAAQMLSQYITAAGIGLAIPEDGQCASACALLYAAAAPRYRYASSNAYFGFHYGVTTGTIFNFGSLVINYERFHPMTVPSILEAFVSEIPNRKADLATFFNSCSKGDPTLSRRVVYLPYRQIVSVVQGSNKQKCDEIIGQDATWFNEQVSPVKVLSKETDR